MARLGRTPYTPAEDQEPDDPSPVELMLFEAEPTLAPLQSFQTLDAEEEETPVFPPWEPTGDETPAKTVQLDLLSATKDTVPPPETAGGGVPSAYIRMRQYGPDEA